MKEFDSIRIVDKGGDSISFEMTGNVAGSPFQIYRSNIVGIEKYDE